ncbi:AMP-dependent synthetase and ligase [Micromonospora sp. L5]|nr:AMP-dependent synthetase and ligase [Micromonospora sp. L5]
MDVADSIRLTSRAGLSTGRRPSVAIQFTHEVGCMISYRTRSRPVRAHVFMGAVAGQDVRRPPWILGPHRGRPRLSVPGSRLSDVDARLVQQLHPAIMPIRGRRRRGPPIAASVCILRLTAPRSRADRSTGRLIVLANLEFFAARHRDGTESAIAQVASEFGVECGSLGAQQSLRPVYVDPVARYAFLARIREVFGSGDLAACFDEHSTIATLSVHLRRHADRRWCLQPAPTVTPPDAPTIYYIHSASGNAFALGAARPALPARIVGIRAAGIEGECPIPTTVRGFVEYYIPQLKAFQPRGPYRLCGFSAGGTIAHAIAVELLAAGDEVDLLALFDSEPPARDRAPLSQSDVIRYRLIGLLRRTGYPITYDDQPPTIAEGHAILQERQAYPLDTNADSLRCRLEVFARTLQATATHEPGWFPGDAHFFLGAHPADVTERWRRHVGRLHTYYVGGEHFEHKLFADPRFNGPFSALLRNVSGRGRPAGPRGLTAPLTGRQLAIWATTAVRGAPTPPVAVRLSLPTGVTPADVRSAVDQLVARHAALRTEIEVLDGVPVQRIHPPQHPALTRAVDAVTAADAGPPSAPGPFPLWDLRLSDRGGPAVEVRIDHTVADGRAVAVLAEDLQRLLAGTSDTTQAAADSTVRYADLALRDRQSLDPRRNSGPHEFWSERLADAVGRLVPPGRPAPARWVPVVDAPRTWTQLDGVGHAADASPAVVRLAVSALALSRLTGCTDLTIGILADFRTPATRDLVGCLVGVLPIRVRVQSGRSFVDLVNECQEQFEDAAAHSGVGYDSIVEASRRGANGPGIQLDVLLNHLPEPEIVHGAVRVHEHHLGAGFPLTIASRGTGERTSIALINGTTGLSDRQLGRWAEAFGLLAADAAARPHVELRHLRSAVTTDRAPATRAEVPVAVNDVMERFVAAATAGPDRVAVVDRGRELTYRQLQEAAGSAVESLRAAGVRPGDRIGLYAHRGAEFVIGLVAALSVGAVAVPLDPGQPSARCQACCEIARPRLVMSVGATVDEATSRYLANAGVPQLEVDPTRRARPASPLPAIPEAGYVFFTSGTTGQPKGVLGARAGLSHFLQWQATQFRFGATDRVGAITGITFDVVLREVLTVLTVGGTVVFGDPLQTGEQIRDWVRADSVTVLHVVPSLARTWLDTCDGPGETPLRLVFFAGEPLQADDVRRWKAAFGPQCRVINLYGPTETTLAKFWYEVEDACLDPLPVGWPLPETELAVVASDGRRCGTDEPGEVWIGTRYRSLGYLGATADPASRLPGEAATEPPWYRTGDLGSYDYDGRLFLRGRLDDQVKVNGVRIELAELTTLLRGLPGVRDAVVVPRPNAAGTELVAFLVSDGTNWAATRASAAAAVARWMPAGVAPSRFARIDSLPLRPSGKVDREALLAALPEAVPNPPDVQWSPAEARVRAIWAEIIGNPGAGPDDSFFSAGGDSLAAVRLAARLSAESGVPVAPADCLLHPTVATQAALLTAATRGRERP